MFMNLDAIPHDQAMYTLYIAEPGWADLAEDDRYVDEVDVVADRNAAPAVIAAALAAGILESYAGQEVVGIVNQSDGYVVYDARNHGNTALVF